MTSFDARATSPALVSRRRSKPTLREAAASRSTVNLAVRSAPPADQTVRPDRELAHSDAGRVPDSICDGARSAGDADLADALDAERIDMRVVLFDEDRLERGDVGVHRHMILAEIGVHHPSRAVIHDGLLVQREGDAPDHAAIILAAD